MDQDIISIVKKLKKQNNVPIFNTKEILEYFKKEKNNENTNNKINEFIQDKFNELSKKTSTNIKNKKAEKSL